MEPMAETIDRMTDEYVRRAGDDPNIDDDIAAEVFWAHAAEFTPDELDAFSRLGQQGFSPDRGPAGMDVPLSGWQAVLRERLATRGER